jgi:hypothetical protein
MKNGGHVTTGARTSPRPSIGTSERGGLGRKNLMGWLRSQADLS